MLAGDESGDWPVGKILLVVNVTGDRATTQLLSASAMRAALGRNPTTFAHIRRGEDVILTAPSVQMVPALRAYLDRPGVLDEPSTWRRITSGKPTEGPDAAMRRPRPMVSPPMAGLPVEIPDPPVEEAGRLPCAVHRSIAVVGGAVGGTIGGGFIGQLPPWGGDHEGPFMAGGAILGVVFAWRDPAPPLLPIRCHRRPATLFP